MSPRHRQAARPAIVAVGAFAVLLVPLAASWAQTGSARAFSALAVADGTRATYVVPGYLLVDTLLDSGTPVAQAVLESSGLSRSFASVAYPGETVVTTPGLLAGLGGAPSLPGYPLYVTADHPTAPEAKQEVPQNGVILRANAGEHGSGSTATMGVDGWGPFSGAVTRIERTAAGTITATAETRSDSVSAGDGILKITSVSTRSKTVLRRSDAKPVTTTELSIDGANVQGQRVSITPDGVRVFGQQVPGASTAALNEALNEALADAGISVRIVEGQELAGGGSADAVEISVTSTVPVPGEPEGTLLYRIGGATTAINLGGGGEDPPPPDPGGSSGESVTTGGNGPAPPTVAPTGQPTGDAGVAIAPAPVAVDPGPARSIVSTEPVRVARSFKDVIRLFYLVIVCGCAALVGGSAVWRAKGVQSRWTL